MVSPARRPRCAGQASADYLAVLAVVGCALGVAGAAVAAGGGLPRALVAEVRTALCLVGGDICRGADAERRGLSPCAVEALERRDSHAITVVVGRAGRERATTIARLSDGRWMATVSDGGDVGVGPQAALRLGPALFLGASGHVSAGFRSGRAWYARSPEEARALLGAERRPPPAEAFLDGGFLGEVSAGAEGTGFAIPLVGKGARRALGRRRSAAGETWYFEARQLGLALLGGSLPQLSLSGSEVWVLELARSPSGAGRQMVLRTARTSRDGRHLEEVSARFDLRDRDTAELAAHLLAGTGPGTLTAPLLRPRVEELRSRLLDKGILSRDVYELSDEKAGLDVELGLGPLGYSSESSATRRRLVRADVFEPDGRRLRRLDCLGLGG